MIENFYANLFNPSQLTLLNQLQIGEFKEEKDHRQLLPLL